MKKFLALFIAAASLAATTVSAYAHYDTAYWSDGNRSTTNTNWMQYVADSKKFSELSIPGTHDSMSYGKIPLASNDIVRNQSIDLYEQLMSGIRFIDIRVHYESPTYLTCYHGPIYLGSDFDEVLSTVQKFLSKYPTETVYMRLKQEQSSASDLEMLTVFNHYYNKYPDLFYKGGNENPTLKETRGKIFLIADVLSLETYGMSYRSLEQQDAYHLNTNWDLYSKWEKIKAQLEKSSANPARHGTINFLSGSGGSMPYFVASGHSSPQTGAPRLATGYTHPGFWWQYPDFPRDSWFLGIASIYFEGTNTLTADWISKNRPSYVGIVAADFPGERLINEIIACNRRSKISIPSNFIKNYFSNLWSFPK